MFSCVGYRDIPPKALLTPSTSGDGGVSESLHDSHVFIGRGGTGVMQGWVSTALPDLGAHRPRLNLSVSPDLDVLADEQGLGGLDHRRQGLGQGRVRERVPPQRLAAAE